ncbi:DASS family sodium-coupled anion symporter [Candidatus Bathyarchaeota archaeon]|nr:DASS family sodium-coupled anion symporter [Candidatus Bathyarchaeota archaeon]
MKKMFFLIGPVLFLLCLMFPTTSDMLEAAQASKVYDWGPKFGLGVLLWTATWWIGEVVPLGITALVPTVLFCFSGILLWKDGLASFTDPLVWVIMVGFLFARSFQIWGLDKRVALKLASISGTRNPILAGFFVGCLPVFLLTITGSMTTSTSITFGFVLAFLSRQGFLKTSRYGSATLIALGQAATAGSLIFLTSTTTNLIAKRVILEVTGVNISFVDWFIIGTPHALIGLFLTWFLVYAIIKPEVSRLPLDRSTLKIEAHSLGPVNRGEWLTLVLLCIAFTFWVSPGLLAIIASFNPNLAQISSTVSKLVPEAAPSVLLMLLFPLLKVGDRPLLKWDEILTEAINWDVVFLVGGGITLGIGLINSGFATWIGNLFRNFAGSSPNGWIIFAISSFVGFLLSYPASNTGAASVACPLAVALSTATGFNPIPSVLGAAIATTIPSSFPSTTPAIAIIYSSGYVKMKDLFKVGMVCDTIRFFLLLLIGYPLTQYFVSLKIG